MCKSHLVLHTAKQGKGCISPQGKPVSVYKMFNSSHSPLDNKEKPEPKLDLPLKRCAQEACKEESGRGEEELMHVRRQRV